MSGRSGSGAEDLPVPPETAHPAAHLLLDLAELWVDAFNTNETHYTLNYIEIQVFFNK